jgi:hypothetical protein
MTARLELDLATLTEDDVKTLASLIRFVKAAENTPVPTPHDIGWAAEQLSKGHAVRRRYWRASECITRTFAGKVFFHGDIVANDWELAK